MMSYSQVFVVSVVVCCVIACPEGYEKSKSGVCLKLFNVETTRDNAESNCEIENATLVVVQDASVNQLITSLASDVKTSVWIGLRCNGTLASDCYYDDGSEVTFLNFYQGFPKAGDFCVFLSSSNKDNFAGKWFTSGCDSSFIYACQAKSS